MVVKKAKKVIKKTKKAMVVVGEALPEGNISSQLLSVASSYDLEDFDNVDLDITDNKELFKNDIVIPKIQLVQTMSEIRIDKKADEGDYVDSKTGEMLLKLVDEEEYLPIIPIKTFKRWHTFELVGQKREFISSEIMIMGKNEDLPYEEVVEGKKLIRRQIISAYVLLGKDAQKGIVKPYIIDFASTSKGAGRVLVSDISVLNARKLPSYVSWFKLSKHEDKNDDGQFFVKQLKFGGMMPKTMMPFLKDAYTEITSMIANNTIEIDDRDVHESAKTHTKVSKKAVATDAGI